MTGQELGQFTIDPGLEPYRVLDKYTGAVNEHAARRDEYRRLLSVNAAARIAYIPGGPINRHAKALDQARRGAACIAIIERALQEADVVLCEFGVTATVVDHFRSDHRQIAHVLLFVPAETLNDRGKVGGLDRPAVAELVRRQAAQVTTENWSTCDQAMALAWDGLWWQPFRPWIEARIRALDPWYQYHEIAGIPVGRHRLNGEVKWRGFAEHLGHLNGAMALDVGCNAGGNAFRMAERGASVVAYEASPLYVNQLALVREFGQWSTATSQRVQCVHAHIQTVPLSGTYDVALLAQVHYHVNRSAIPPYRSPRMVCDGLLRPPLAVLLEDVAEQTRKLVLVTNLSHVTNPPKRRHEEAAVEWLQATLPRAGFRDVTVHAGASAAVPVLVALGKRA